MRYTLTRHARLTSDAHANTARRLRGQPPNLQTCYMHRYCGRCRDTLQAIPVWSCLRVLRVLRAGRHEDWGTPMPARVKIRHDLLHDLFRPPSSQCPDARGTTARPSSVRQGGARNLPSTRRRRRRSTASALLRRSGRVHRRALGAEVLIASAVAPLGRHAQRGHGASHVGRSQRDGSSRPCPRGFWQSR